MGDNEQLQSDIRVIELEITDFLRTFKKSKGPASILKDINDLKYKAENLYDGWTARMESGRSISSQSRLVYREDLDDVTETLANLQVSHHMINYIYIILLIYYYSVREGRTLSTFQISCGSLWKNAVIFSRLPRMRMTIFFRGKLKAYARGQRVIMQNGKRK